MQDSLTDILQQALKFSRQDCTGNIADYIPELASVDPERTSVAVKTLDGAVYTAGEPEQHLITLQSVSKVILLLGILEELGRDELFKWVSAEPSGTDFASIARLDKHGPLPCNPLINAGAIALCDKIPCETDKVAWLESWIERLFGQKMNVNAKVFASEQRTGHRNRAIAYLLKNSSIISGEVDSVLETYFCLCSFELSVLDAVELPFLLANGGVDASGKRILSPGVVRDAVSIMATCGLYNETGTHMVRTGMPAKSGVSGLTVALLPKFAGISVASPRVNRYGTSIRGEIILQSLSEHSEGWHFATPE
jgi:glutaminase